MSSSFSYFWSSLILTSLSFVALILLSGCDDDNPSHYDFSLEPYDFISYDGDTISAKMGKFKVKENRKSGSEKLIELAFVLFPSTNPNPDYPIVYLAGGPGGSGINAARGSRFDLFMAMREIGDVIAFDQRATGVSSPFEFEECQVSFPRPKGEPLSHERLIDFSLKAAHQCAQFWRAKGIDINAYNTLESAADVEDLRKVLSVDKLNLWGISYGTHLGLSVIKYYPKSVSKAILAGVEGPDHTVKLPSYSENQLDNLKQLISNKKEMRNKHPNLKRTIVNTLKKQEEHPVTIEYEDPDSESKETVVVGRPELERLSISLLRDPSTMVTLPSLFKRISSNDYLALVSSPEVEFEMEAMEESMDAASGMSTQRKDKFINQAKETVFGGGTQLGNELMGQALGIEDLGSDFRSSIESNLEVLFIGGTLDGRTPMGNAYEVSKGFRNASFLTIENGGHSNDLLISSPDIEAAMFRFMKGTKIDNIITIAPPDFDNIKTPVSLSFETIQKYLGTYSDGASRTWTVIPKGTYTVKDNQGKITQSNSIIQVRIEPNGYTLQALDDSTFFVEIPGWQDITFEFNHNPNTEEMELSYKENGLQKIMVKKIH